MVKVVTEDQKGLVPSYADNTRTKQLFKFINNEQELTRLNKHRRTHWSQAMLNEVIVAAIKMRNEYVGLYN